MIIKNIETDEQPQEESPEQRAESEQLKEMARKIDAEAPIQGKKETGKAEVKNPAESFRQANTELRKAQEEWDNFRNFADGVMKKFGKRIQDFDENNPKEKEFIDYWDSEEKRYRDTFAKYGEKPRTTLQDWKPGILK